MSENDPLEVFRRLLDERNWPPGRRENGHYMIVEGEIWAFRASGDPEEECIYKVLYQ